jgi:hypothetical protein
MMNNYQMQDIERAQLEPSGYAEYMATYGGHFSKKMCEWAVGMMKVDEKRPNGEKRKKKLEPWSKEEVDNLLVRYGITLENDKGYDKVYVANMCKADFLGKSVPGENEAAMYVKDLLDDPDGYDEMVFNRFMMDCMGRGIPIMWEDML